MTRYRTLRETMIAATMRRTGRDRTEAEAIIDRVAARLAPEFLDGDDGEVVFVRADLALSATEARGRALAEGYNLHGFDADVVAMLEVPEHFTGIDYEWSIVVEGTPGAVRFYRFRL